MTTHSKLCIIEAAKNLFGENGFEKTSVRDIAKKAKVNIAMVSYYFGCKEHLYEQCIIGFAEKNLPITEDLLKPVKSKEEFKQCLQQFIAEMMTTLNDNGSLFKMFLREMMNETFAKKKSIHKATSPFFGIMKNFFQTAIDNGVVSKKYNAEMLLIIFIGALSHPIHAEYKIKLTMDVDIQDPEFQKKFSENLLNVFLNGVY